MITEIKNDSDINEAIEALEQTKILQKENLTHSFELKVQSLKPANLIKSVVSQVTTKPSLKKSVLIAAAGLATVLVVKKISSSKSSSKGLLYMALSGAGTILV